MHLGLAYFREFLTDNRFSRWTDIKKNPDESKQTQINIVLNIFKKKWVKNR